MMASVERSSGRDPARLLLLLLLKESLPPDDEMYNHDRI